MADYLNTDPTILHLLVCELISSRLKTQTLMMVQETPWLPIFWSENLTLLPGESRTVNAQGPVLKEGDEKAAPLYVRVRGWNVVEKIVPLRNTLRPI